MAKSILRLATRTSPLALWQANEVKHQLHSHHPHLQIELIGLITAGDKRTDIALTQIGGKSLFVKELQNALLDNKADIAVHSVKDMSVTPTAGLALTTVCQRGDPRDALVAKPGYRWENLPLNAIVGTTSPRRQCQLLAHRPDLIIRTLRGNVGSRLAKLDQEEFDAIVLASAGLTRLGLAERISDYLNPDQFIPAIGQGALGIECRTEDQQTQNWLSCLNDLASQQCIEAERAVNRRLGGDCYTPIGAYAVIAAENLNLSAMVGSLDGKMIIKDQVSGHRDQAAFLGELLAEKLLSKGAEDLCRSWR